MENEKKIFFFKEAICDKLIPVWDSNLELDGNNQELPGITRN